MKKKTEDKNPERVSEGITRQRVMGVNEIQAENKRQTRKKVRKESDSQRNS